MTVSDAYGISSEIARKSWQRLWDNESTGRYTYNCIPMVGTKVMFSKIRNIGIAYSRMLLTRTGGCVGGIYASSEVPLS